MSTPVEGARGFADLPGVRIAYDRAGHGDPVIFLHGGLLDRRMWDDQFTFFAQRFEAIRYDMRSAGQSETPPSTDPFTHHDDLYQLLSALKISQVALVGLSNYAVALDFALAYPALVHKLVLVSPGLRAYAFRDAWVGARFTAMLQALEQRDLAGAVEVFLTMWVDGPYRTAADINPVIRERVRAMVAHAFPMSRHAPNVHGIEPPAIHRLADVRVPTLIVVGDQDASDIQAIGQLLHAQVAGSTLVTVPAVGHTLVMEKPDDFNHLVEAFLRT